MSPRILVIQTAFIGDVVLATPVVETLSASFPNSRIDFLLRKGHESLLDNNPHLNRVITFDKKKKYKNLIKLIKIIRSESYHYVINLQRHFTTGLITALSGAEIKVGFDKNPLSFLFTKRVKHSLSKRINIHEIHRNLSLIEELTDRRIEQQRLYPSKEDFKTTKESDKYVCIAPSSVWFTKKLPLYKWCELVDKIPSTYKIFLLGSSKDSILCEEIKQKTSHQNVKILAGKLSFLQSAALMKGAEMNFTNDSAPLHFASAMNAPVTAFFCSTIPEFGFGPLSDLSYIAQTSEQLNCRPCGLHGKKTCPKKHFKCSNINLNKVLTSCGIL